MKNSIKNILEIWITKKDSNKVSLMESKECRSLMPACMCHAHTNSMHDSSWLATHMKAWYVLYSLLIWKQNLGCFLFPDFGAAPFNYPI